jgi:hypothetical protein
MPFTMTKKEQETKRKYKEQKRIQATLDFLRQCRFEKRVDVLKEYTAHGEELYCIPLAGRQCLVAQHYNSKKRVEFQGFTLWLSEYENYQDIGKREAISIINLKQSFNPEKDKSVVVSYLLQAPGAAAVRD